MDNVEAVQAVAIINIIMISIVLIFYILIVFIIRYDSDTKFKYVFEDIVARIEEISRKMDVYSSSDQKIRNPLKFYSDLITRMRDRAEIDGKKFKRKKKKLKNSRKKRNKEEDSPIVENSSSNS